MKVWRTVALWEGEGYNSAMFYFFVNSGFSYLEELYTRSKTLSHREKMSLGSSI